jgi:hypothetical protein
MAVGTPWHSFRKQPPGDLGCISLIVELWKSAPFQPARRSKMKNGITAIFLSGLLCAAAIAQSPSGQDSTPPAQPAAQAPASQPAANQPQAGSTLRIAPGSVIPVQLTKTIDAKKMKTGEEVTAKVTQDMKTTTGEVLVPKDTEVIGHVTAAQARSKEQK